MIQIKIEGKNCHADFFSVGIEQAISFLRAWESVENSSEGGQACVESVFKAGEVVRVVAKKNGHEFNIGDVVKIKKSNFPSLPWLGRGVDCGFTWYLGEDEIEKIS